MGSDAPASRIGVIIMDVKRIGLIALTLLIALGLSFYLWSINRHGRQPADEALAAGRGDCHIAERLCLP
jgi:hypothetical protein